jgi:uncharacterized coiled-coil protein SlyX
MDEKSTSIEGEQDFIGTRVGTSTASPMAYWNIFGMRTINLRDFGELQYEDSDTFAHFQDQVIRELATKLVEARKDLESLRKVELLSLPDKLILNPLNRQQSRIEIGKIAHAKFQFRED